MQSNLSRGIKVSDLARWEWCNEESFLRCNGVERAPTVYDFAGTNVHKKVIREPQKDFEKIFFEKLNMQRPFFRVMHDVKIFGGVDAIESEGLKDGIVRFIECKTRGERSVPPFLIKPAIFQLEIYAWLFQPIIEKIGYKLADVHYVDFVHRESMEIIKRYDCLIDYGFVDEKIGKIMSSIIKNEGISGAYANERWKCRNCAVEYKNKCRFFKS